MIKLSFKSQVRGDLLGIYSCQLVNFLSNILCYTCVFTVYFVLGALSDPTKVIHTEMMLAPEEFDNYQIGVDTDVTFCLKELRVNSFTTTTVWLVTWPLNKSEVGGDLVKMETLLLLLCKFLVISMRSASLT